MFRGSQKFNAGAGGGKGYFTPEAKENAGPRFLHSTLPGAEDRSLSFSSVSKGLTVNKNLLQTASVAPEVRHQGGHMKESFLSPSWRG